jgi:signal transduction histidine kinase
MKIGNQIPDQVSSPGCKSLRDERSDLKCGVASIATNDGKVVGLSQSKRSNAVCTLVSRAKVNSFVKSPFVATPGGNRRRELIQIQWFVAIACSYLLIVQDGQVAHDGVSLFLLSLPLGMMAMLLRLPESALSHRLFPCAMAVVDALLFTTAIVYNRQSPWDLCLVFFVGILISAIGENLLQIIIGSLVVGAISVLIVPVSDNGGFAIDSNTLLRIPLIFGASLVYGHLSDQIKREQKKTARVEEMRRYQLSTKDRFISHISHELRTPLTAIYQFSTILSDGLAGDLTEQQREYLDIVQRNVGQLQTMVDDLLEAARADGGKLAINPQAISLQQLVRETIDNHRTSAAQKSITLSAEVPNDSPAVYADPQRVKQILTNLIDNGIKFTPVQGTITVKAQLVEAEPRLVRVSVIDSGCGISADATKRIFDRLYQEENLVTTNRKGLGLGLHICDQLVSRQGGRIWVESELGKGSTFHFTLPVFSLSRLLAPFVEQCHGFATGLAIIAIEVKADGRIDSSVIGKAAWDEKWDRLMKFAFPADALLLPRITVAGERERFFVLSGGDGATAHQLAGHIEKEIGVNRRAHDTQYGVKTSLMVIDPPPSGSTDMEALTESLSRQIIELAGLSTLQETKLRFPSMIRDIPSTRRNETSPGIAVSDR